MPCEHGSCLPRKVAGLTFWEYLARICEYLHLTVDKGRCLLQKGDTWLHRPSYRPRFSYLPTPFFVSILWFEGSRDPFCIPPFPIAPSFLALFVSPPSPAASLDCTCIDGRAIWGRNAQVTARLPPFYGTRWDDCRPPGTSASPLHLVLIVWAVPRRSQIFPFLIVISAFFSLLVSCLQLSPVL